jgi:hypothetical protein
MAVKRTTQIKTPAGEGERRAIRGYIRQYDLAARLIYEAVASGGLRWVALADPLAGQFDDVVLGFEGLVVGYQAKSSRDPDRFRLSAVGVFGQQ